MSEYKALVYGGKEAFLFSTYDLFSTYTFSTAETLEEFSKRLARSGFMANNTKWIMPSAILSVEVVK